MHLRTRHSQNNHVDDSEYQDAKVSELRAALGTLASSERGSKFCSDSCLRRYLKVRNWNVDKAKTMLEETLRWRETYKPEEILWDEVAQEGETGKAFKANFHDRSGRTVIIISLAKENSNDPERTIRFFVYILENAIFSLPEGQEQVSWLINFRGWRLTTKISPRTSREIINIIQCHYPERMAIAILYNPPRIFEAFWKVIRYFMDSSVYQTIKFVYPKDKEGVDLLRSLFDVENLPSDFGGKATLTYNHEEYSKQMVKEEVKTAKFWGIRDKKNKKKIIHTFGAGGAPEEPLAMASSGS